MRLSRLIRESLDRRASPLRLGDHLGNACQQRLAAHALGAHHEGSTAVHGASGRVLHGNRLSGDHRLVDGTGVVATTPPTEMRSPGGRAANRLPPEGTSSSMKPVPASNAIARTSSRRWSARVGLLIRGAGFEFRTARLSRPRGTVRPRSHAAIDVALLWCRARNSNDRSSRLYAASRHHHHEQSRRSHRRVRAGRVPEPGYWCPGRGRGQPLCHHVQLLRGDHETVSPLTAPTPLNRATAALTKTGRSDRAAGRPHHLDATG
jgi:hypothetical protein